MAKSYLILLFCVFIWASNYIGRQILLRYFSPTFLSAFSLSVVSLVFLLWTASTRSFIRITRKEMVWFCLSALIGLVANQILLFNGLKYSTATNASLIFSTSPLITAGLAAVFLSEMITKRMIAGSLVAIFGIFQVLNVSGHFNFQIGDLMLLGATFTFSCNLIFIRILSRRLSPFIITVYSFALSSILFDPFALSISKVSWNHSIYVWVLAFVSVILAQGVTGVMWNTGMNVVGAARSSIVLNIQPLMTILLDYLVFAREVHVQQIIGAVFVFTGVVLGTMEKGFFTNKADVSRPADPIKLTNQ